MNERVLLGKRIKELRRSRDLSQEQLAEKTGINAKYLSSIERGRENPTLDLLIKLAKKGLGVEMGSLFNYPPRDLPTPEARKRLRALVESADAARLREMLALLGTTEES